MAALATPGTGWAHARLTTPAPRNNQDGYTLGPCGNAPRTTAPTTYRAGQAIPVIWQETVAHPGTFRIAFSPANDQGFDQNVLASNLANPGGTGTYNTGVTLPSTPCSACTLQLVQLRTDQPAISYYSCADIVILPPMGMDAGTDAGTAIDAGRGDAGIPPADAGQPDAAPPSLDAGLSFDAATPERDGGPPPDDAGAPGLDSGSATAGPDAAVLPLNPIAPGNDPLIGGCACHAGAGGVPILAAFGLLRRRRRGGDPK